MASLIQKNFRARKTFAKLKQVIEIPNLIDIQKRSYDKFLQIDIPIDKREDIGLQGVFKSVFPIKDFSETSSLEFVSYNLEKPKYDVDECRARGMTFAAPIKVVIRLVVWDVNEETGVQSIRDVKEQEVYFGEIPLMTDSGTFIINGTERVIVSQLHRSPGVFFDHDKGKTHSSRQAALQRPRDPVPRLVARLRVRPQGHPLRPHRSPPQAARDRAAARARLLDRGAAQLLLRHRDDPLRAAEEVQPPGQLRAARRPARDARHQAPEDEGSPRQEEPQVHQGCDPQAAGVGRRPAADRPRRARRQGLARRTSSTSRPARCSSSATRS